MTEAEEQELRALSAEIAGVMHSPWQPRCIARMFATPRKLQPVLTMQGWIDLEDLQSPILQGQLPASVEELEQAAGVFGLSLEGLTPDESVDVGTALVQAVREAFAMSLAMRPPQSTEPGETHGFGDWLPTYTCLVTQCGLGRMEARETPVGEAFALIATMRHNQGWYEAGTPYAVRDLDAQKKEEQANG